MKIAQSCPDNGPKKHQPDKALTAGFPAPGSTLYGSLR
jgi:hypothetical protein